MPSVSIRGSAVREGTTGSDPQFLTWTITLSEPATGPMSIDLRYLSGTGIAGADAYASGSAERIRFDAGESSKTVRFRIDADNVAEADETIVLEAFNVEGGDGLIDRFTNRYHSQRRHRIPSFFKVRISSFVFRIS